MSRRRGKQPTMVDQGSQRISRSQQLVLKNLYAHTLHPTKEEREKAALETDLDEKWIKEWFETTRSSTVPHTGMSSSRRSRDPSTESENATAATRLTSTSTDRPSRKKPRPRSPRPPLAPVSYTPHHDQPKPSNSQNTETLLAEYLIHNTPSLPTPIPATRLNPAMTSDPLPGLPFIHSSSSSVALNPESAPLLARARSPSLGYIPVNFPLRFFELNAPRPASYQDPARVVQSQNQSFFVPLGPSFPKAIFSELADCSLSDHLPFTSNSIASIAPYPLLPVAFQARLDDIMPLDRRIDNTLSGDITSEQQVHEDRDEPTDDPDKTLKPAKESLHVRCSASRH